MIGIFKRLTLLVVIALGGCGQAEFTFSNGQVKTLETQNSQWVIINYWATWCKPCIEEVPELNALNRQPDVEVWGVNYDGLQGDALIREAAQLGIEFDLLVGDPSEKIQIERPRALPATVLIDPQGVTRVTLFGPQTERSIIEKLNTFEK